MSLHLPQLKPWDPAGESASVDMAQLQEEANKALDCQLATKSSLDARQRKQVSNFGMTLHLIESETTEAIKAAKALCTHTIWDGETHHMVLVSKAKV